MTKHPWENASIGKFEVGIVREVYDNTERAMAIEASSIIGGKMAKKKTDLSIDTSDLFAELAAKTGGQLVVDMQGSKYFVDTGNLALNKICSGKYIGGGIPGGKITELYGPSSSSKSLIGSNVLYGTQKIGGVAIKLDTENADNPDFMKSASHLDLNKVIRYTPQTLEEAFSKMYNVMRAVPERFPTSVPMTLVYDSISVSPSERESREVDLPENPTDAQWKKIVGAKEQPGERAKICSRELRKLTPLLEEMNATLLIINQTRMKIGVMYGNPETTAGGGNALPFYASCRLRTSTAKKIENKKIGKVLGVNVNIKNVKNRSCPPFISTEGLQLLFANGINPVSGLLSLLVADERIEMTSNGVYQVKPEFAGGKTEYKFKSSLVRNDVPVQALIDCPALIDGESSEAVQEYLKPYMAALEITGSEDVTETAVKSDEMDTSEDYDNAGEQEA